MEEIIDKQNEYMREAAISLILDKLSKEFYNSLQIKLTEYTTDELIDLCKKQEKKEEIINNLIKIG